MVEVVDGMLQREEDYVDGDAETVSWRANTARPWLYLACHVIRVGPFAE